MALNDDGDRVSLGDGIADADEGLDGFECRAEGAVVDGDDSPVDDLSRYDHPTVCGCAHDRSGIDIEVDASMPEHPVADGGIEGAGDGDWILRRPRPSALR